MMICIYQWILLLFIICCTSKECKSQLKNELVLLFLTLLNALLIIYARDFVAAEEGKPVTASLKETAQTALHLS